MHHYDRQPLPRFARYWLLGALLLVLLPHLLRFPFWLTIACLAVIGWRLMYDLRGWPLPGSSLRFLLTFIGIGSVALAYHSIIGLSGGVALLATMLCIKLIEIRNRRDAMIALSIGYFLLIGGFLFSQSLFMGAYLFSVVLALTAALIALNHQGSRGIHHRLYLRTGGALLLQAIPLMLVMFILFPRISSPLWSMPTDGGIARTGLSDSIRMGTITQLAESREVAFRVKFDDSLPSAENLYWRGPVLWKTDGRIWHRLAHPAIRKAIDYRPLGESLRYTVTLEPHSMHWLFALDLPATLPVGTFSGDIVFTADYQLLSKNIIDQRIRYDSVSYPQYRMETLSDLEREQALQLPSGVNPQTYSLAIQWRDSGLDAAARVQQALDYFSTQPFYYTRTPPQLGENPVDEFLFNSRQGFCEHFATSFVTLMRAAGVPSRVVTGYQGGELNQLGDYLIIRQSNAHAWAEVWLDERGWVRVDPTAAIPPERVLTSVDANRFRTTTIGDGNRQEFSLFARSLLKFRHGWDAINNGWNQWVLGFDRQRQEQLLRTLGLGNLSWSHVIILMIILLFSMLAMIGLFLVIRRPHQRDPVLRLYQRFCRKLEKTGIVRRADEGPRNFAYRVASSRADLAAAVKEITTLYEVLRYGRESSQEQKRALRRKVAEFHP